MSFDAASAVDGMSEALLNNKTIKLIAGSSILTSVVLTILIMIIIFIVFSHQTLLTARAGFWVLLTTILFLHLHQKILTTSTVGTYEAFEPVKIGPITVDSLT
jgi:hypothetical protein